MHRRRLYFTRSLADRPAHRSHTNHFLLRAKSDLMLRGERERADVRTQELPIVSARVGGRLKHENDVVSNIVRSSGTRRERELIHSRTREYISLFRCPWRIIP